MPLPPSLAAKLAKRGLYTPPRSGRTEVSQAARGHDGCPNRYNIYHECDKFCATHWKSGSADPDVRYLRRKERLLRRYPLPVGWREVFDRGCGRCYFWDVERDLVSWYPPKHPRAAVGRSAARLREELQQRVEEEREAARRSDRPQRHGRATASAVVSTATAALRPVHKKEGALDPMDPAAYSDVPRGTWATGLEVRGDAKTGADVTASGPLYQSRPYPSPGAVLAANKAKPTAR